MIILKTSYCDIERTAKNSLYYENSGALMDFDCLFFLNDKNKQFHNKDVICLESEKTGKIVPFHWFYSKSNITPHEIVTHYHHKSDLGAFCLFVKTLKKE